jgi:hypothetical protein
MSLISIEGYFTSVIRAIVGEKYYKFIPMTEYSGSFPEIRYEIKYGNKEIFRTNKINCIYNSGSIMEIDGKAYKIKKDGVEIRYNNTITVYYNVENEINEVMDNEESIIEAITESYALELALRNGNYRQGFSKKDIEKFYRYYKLIYGKEIPPSAYDSSGNRKAFIPRVTE